MEIAVVGGGVSGLGAAWALAREHVVTVYESDASLGGHANTVDVLDAGRSVAVDTGFIVYNELNYPNVVRLFEALDVDTEPSNMSFSVSMGDGMFEYQARGVGLLAQPSNLARVSYLRMVGEILRFMREANALVGSGSRESTGEFLARRDFSRSFLDDFLLPMVACIWSSRLRDMLDYPAETMARFLDNHGLLQVARRPAWRTVSGGSREYVRRLRASLSGAVRLRTPVTSLLRLPGGVLVRDDSGRMDRFDHVVMATHADTSLEILGNDASIDERRLLGAFRYQQNRAVLHRDASLMPRRRRAWSSWNYISEDRHPLDLDRRVSLSYWMNHLQNLRTEQPVIMTLNPLREPREAVYETTYHHPRYDRAAIDAQAEIPTIQGVQRTWFCGSYCGFGFHEDALRAGLSVAAALGSPAPWWDGPAAATSSARLSDARGPAEPVGTGA